MNGELIENQLSGRKKRDATIWPWRLIIFSFTLLVIAGAVFVGLRFGYGDYVREEIASTDKAIDDLAKSISSEDQVRFLAFYRQLATLRNVMDNHVASSKVFDWLERQTHEKVFFSSLDFDSKSQTLSLNATADSYAIIIEQLEVLERLPEVESYETGRLQQTEERVVFDLKIKLKTATYLY